MLHFNAEGCVDSSRCTAVAWVPGTQGGAFVAAHASGSLHIYHKAGLRSQLGLRRLKSHVLRFCSGEHLVSGPVGYMPEGRVYSSGLRVLALWLSRVSWRLLWVLFVASLLLTGPTLDRSEATSIILSRFGQDLG